MSAIRSSQVERRGSKQELNQWTYLRTSLGTSFSLLNDIATCIRLVDLLVAFLSNSFRRHCYVRVLLCFKRILRVTPRYLNTKKEELMVATWFAETLSGSYETDVFLVSTAGASIRSIVVNVRLALHDFDMISGSGRNLFLHLPG